MGIREEIAAIQRQTETLRRISDELRADRDAESMAADRAEWEADEQAQAEYEAWINRKGGAVCWPSEGSK